MAKALLFVFTNPASAEEEAEYNEWYDTVHGPSIQVKNSGVVAVSRYAIEEVTEGTRPGNDPSTPDRNVLGQTHAAIYEIEADDEDGLKAVIRGIRERKENGEYRMSSSLDLSPEGKPVLYLFRPLDETQSVSILP